MDVLAPLLSLLCTLLTVLTFGVLTLLMTALPMMIMGFVIYRLLTQGGTVVVSGPMAQALAGHARGPGPPKLNLVKVGTCSACGAHRSTVSASAYVHCDQCGQLTDWDFKAAMADRRSKAPGPAYEGLLKRAHKGLAAAKEADDRDAYLALQAEIWEAYARACPAACPPRVGDEVYRKKWVAWSAESQTLQDLDAGCAETFAAQQQATAALQWDRSNPLQPVAEATSFLALQEAVLAHQQRVVDTLVAAQLLEAHPDRPDAAVFRRIGVAAFVQGWLPYLPKAQHQPLLESTGLDGEYIEPPAVDLTSGSCPSCSAPLEVPAEAKRVVCIACGHGVSVRGGELPCLGCGAPLEVPPDADDVACSHCDTHVRRIGLG